MRQVIAVLFWVFGCVIAQGFWSTTFAVLVPFWAWYLSAEYVFMFLPVP